MQNPQQSPGRSLLVRAEIWGSDMDRFVLRNPFVEIDGVLVDLDAFAAPAGCEMCGNCCLDGVTVPRETALKLAPHLGEISRRYLPPGRADKAGWKYSRSWDTDFTNIVKIAPGRTGCGFLYEKEGRLLCSIHSWAVDTGRDPLEHLPFECFMYPVAILPYDGLLHPGKHLLTIRSDRNTGIVDVYGPGRAVRRSLLRRLLLEVRTWIGRKTGLLRKGPGVAEDCYFRNTPGVKKSPAYLYFSGAVSWNFGKDFQSKLAEAVERHRSAGERSTGDGGTGPRPRA